MAKTRIVQFTCAVSVVLVLAPCCALAEGFSLNELVQASLRDSSQHKSSQLLLRAAAQRHLAEENSFWPRLSIESTHGRNEVGSSAARLGRDNGQGWVSQFSIGTSWNLWDNGEFSHKTELSQLEMLRTEAEQKLAGLDNRRKLAMGFFAWQKIDVQEEIDREVRQLLTTQFKRVERQFRQGLKTSRDYHRMRAELKRFDLQDASKAFRRAEVVQQISLLSGIPSERLKARGAARLAILPESGQNLVAQLKRSSDSSLRDEIERLKLESSRLEAQRGDHLRVFPEIRLSVSAQYGTAGYLPEFEPSFSDGLRPSWSALLSINHELWDWGVRRARSQASWDILRAEEIKWADAQQQRQTDRQTSQIKLTELSKQYDLAVELLQLEQSNFDLVQAEFRDGKLAYLDMITALRELSAARRQRFDLYFQIVEQLAEIHFAEGNLDEWTSRF